MLQRVTLVTDPTVDDPTFNECMQMASALADVLQEPVAVARVSAGRLKVVRSALLAAGGAPRLEVLQPRPAVSRAPMSSAAFLWREDGRPDWAEMWTGFCELALYGGPPHRGEDTALLAPEPERAATAVPDEQPWDNYDPITEIRRGIWETTGLFTEPAEEPGWIVVSCDSRRMAAWLCASIILENVDARCEEERLYLPASRDFHLKNEVKSVITVLAKTHHYWQAHIEAQQAAAAAAS